MADEAIVASTDQPDQIVVRVIYALAMVLDEQVRIYRLSLRRPADGHGHRRRVVHRGVGVRWVPGRVRLDERREAEERAVAVAGDEVHRPVGRPRGGVVLLRQDGYLGLIIQLVPLAVRLLDVSVALLLKVLQELIVLPVRGYLLR